MISATTLKGTLKSYFDNVDHVSDTVLKCKKLLSGEPYQLYYFDFSNRLDNLDIEDYSKDLLSEEYYKNPNSLQWNLYLTFITENEIDTNLRTNIESNEDFARKKIVRYTDLDDWLRRIYIKDSGVKEKINEDLSDTWRNILKKNGLDCVYSQKISDAKGIKGIINGKRATEQIKIDSNISINDKLISFGNLRSLNFKNYRKYPKGIENNKFGRINLIIGANGSGKTSLLEAIEYLITGANFRSGKPQTQYYIDGTFTNNSLMTSRSITNALLRERDKTWYGSVAVQRGSRLNENFNKYNFFNTDAAFRLSMDKGQAQIEQAFKDIALGEDLNYLKREIDDYKKKLEIEKRPKIEEKSILESEIKSAEVTIKDLETKKITPQKIFEVLLKELANLRWKTQLPKSLDDDTGSLYADIFELNLSLQGTLKKIEFLNPLSVKSLKREKDILQSLYSSSVALENELIEIKKNLIGIQSIIDEAKPRLNLLKKVQPYYLDSKIIKNLVGLNNRINDLENRISNISQTQIPYSIVDTTKAVKKKTKIDEEVIILNKELDRIIDKEKEINFQIKSLKTSLDNLQVIESQIRTLGLEHIKLGSHSKKCPLCKSAFKSTTELIKRIQGTSDVLASSKMLSDLSIMQSNLNKDMEAVKNQISDCNMIKITAERLGELDAIDELSIQQLIDKIDVRFKEITSLENDLVKLKDLRRQYKVRDLIEDDLYSLQNSLVYQTGYEDKITKQWLEQSISKLETTLSKSQNDFRAKRTRELEIKKQLEEILIDYFIDDESEKNSNTLKSKLYLIEQVLELLKSNNRLVQIQDDMDIRDFSRKVEKLEKICREYIDKRDSFLKGNSMLTKNRKIVTSNIERIENLNQELNNIESVLKVFSDIYEDHSEADYLNNFLKSNKAEIQNIFLAIHSPNEFREISINKGEIVLTKVDSSKVGLESISTGQRSALAISIFLTLNNKLNNGPNLLIFDDPVSFTDDLNLLSFIDYLRQIIINDPNKQIFFATANENAAYLFRKKFEIFGKDFTKTHLVR